MRKINSIIMLLAVLLAGACFNAHADDTGCRATITTLDGEVVKVKNLASRLLESAFPGTQLMVSYDQGESILDLGDLRAMTRLSPPGKAKQGTKVWFSFKDKQGKTGKFKIWENYIFSGEIQEGNWSEQAASIKTMHITCPPPIKLP